MQNGISVSPKTDISVSIFGMDHGYSEGRKMTITITELNMRVSGMSGGTKSTVHGLVLGRR